jgi:hypothetical protein
LKATGNAATVDLLLDMSATVLCVWTDAEMPHRAKMIIERVADLEQRRLTYGSASPNVRRSLRNALFGDGPLTRAGGRERAVERILKRHETLLDSSALIASFE